MTFDALVLRLGRTTAVTMDVPAVLADVCCTARAVLGVRGVVAAARLGTTDLDPVAGSDDTAVRIGRLQREARNGPLATVMSAGRPMLTTDLLRVGPPELAAAAADTGITNSLAIPLVVAGEAVGAVQLLGDVACPAGPGLAEPLAGVLDVLAARLVDARLASSRGAGPAEPRTDVIPLVAPGAGNDVDSETTVLRAESSRGAGRHQEPDADRSRAEPPVATTPGAALPIVPAVPGAARHASPPTPRSRRHGHAEVPVPAQRYHDQGAATFGATAAAATTVAEPLAEEDAAARPGRRRRDP
jgi:hypothetical protein